MQIKQGTKPGQCDAMRCKDPATMQIDGKAWGRTAVHVCPRHYGQAISAGMIEASAPAVIDVPHETPEALPQTEAAEAEAEALAVVSEARAFVISTQEEIDFAGEILGEIKAKAKDLDEREKAITRPLNDALKAARALFKPAKTHLEEAEALIKKAIARFHDETAERHRIAMHEASLAHAAGDRQAAELALSTVATLEGVEGVRASRVWDFEIMNADEIPRAFLVPDAVAIRAHMRRIVEMGETPEIPGVRFYQETRIAAKARPS
jgi:hypothetical protein